MADEIYDVLDEHGSPTGATASWTEVHAKGLRHQGAGVFVFDTPKRERLLIQRRSKTILQFPDRLHVSAGGHARSGQSAEECARSELQEELFAHRQLPQVTLHYITTFWQQDMPLNIELLHIFECFYPGPFFPEPKEVAGIAWVRWDDLLIAVKQHPEHYVDSFLFMLHEYRKKTGR